MKNNTYTLLGCLSVAGSRQNLIGEVRMPRMNEGNETASDGGYCEADEHGKEVIQSSPPPQENSDEAVPDAAARQVATAATEGAGSALTTVETANESSPQEIKARVDLWYKLGMALQRASRENPALNARITALYNEIRGSVAGTWTKEANDAAATMPCFKSEKAFQDAAERLADTAGWGVDWSKIVRSDDQLGQMFAARVEEQIPWEWDVKGTRQKYRDAIYVEDTTGDTVAFIGRRLHLYTEQMRDEYANKLPADQRDDFDKIIASIRKHSSGSEMLHPLYADMRDLELLLRRCGAKPRDASGAYSLFDEYDAVPARAFALARISDEVPTSRAEARLYLDTVKEIEGTSGRDMGGVIAGVLSGWGRELAAIRQRQQPQRKTPAPATPPEPGAPADSTDVVATATPADSPTSRPAGVALATGRADALVGGVVEKTSTKLTDERRLDIAAGLGFSRAQLQEAFDAKGKDGAELVAAVRKGQGEVWDALSEEQRKELPPKFRSKNGFMDGVWGGGSQGALEKLAGAADADPKWEKMAEILRPRFAVRSSEAAAETRVAETAPGAGEKVKLTQTRFLEKATRPLIGEEVPLKAPIKLRDKGGKEHTLDKDEHVIIVNIPPSSGKVTVTPFRGFSGERYAVAAGKLNFEDAGVKGLIDNYYETTGGGTELALMEARWRGENAATEKIAAEKSRAQPPSTPTAESVASEKPAVATRRPAVPEGAEENPPA